eukprot:gene10463-6503_t
MQNSDGRRQLVAGGRGIAAVTRRCPGAAAPRKETTIKVEGGVWRRRAAP